MTTGKLEQLRAMWDAGWMIADMAETAGMPYNSVWTVIERNRGKFPHRRHHIGWWRARLARLDGLTSAQAAARLGCSMTTVKYWRAKVRRLDDAR